MRRWRSGNVKGGECTCSAAAVAWALLNVGFFLGLGRQYHEMSANERAVSHSHMGDRSSRGSVAWSMCRLLPPNNCMHVPLIQTPPFISFQISDTSLIDPSNVDKQQLRTLHLHDWSYKWARSSSSISLSFIRMIHVRRSEIQRFIPI